MPAGQLAPMDARSQTLAKVAAFICFAIAAGLLIASVLYPSAARAGSKDLRMETGAKSIQVRN